MFGNSGRKYDFTRKNNFFWGLVLDQNNNNLKMLLGMSLKFYSNLAKSNEVMVEKLAEEGMVEEALFVPNPK